MSSAWVAFQTIETVLEGVGSFIEEKSITEVVKLTMGVEGGAMIVAMNDQGSMNRPFLTPLRQEIVSEIPHIAKDSLMPKDVTPEKFTPSSTPKKTPILHKSLRRSHQPTPISNSQRSSRLRKERRGVRAISGLQDSRKWQRLPSPPDQDTPQVKQMKYSYEIQWKYDEQYMAMQAQRQKSLISQRQQVQEMKKTNPEAQVGQDYDHQFIASCVGPQKIKTYIMRTEFAPGRRNLQRPPSQSMNQTIDVPGPKTKGVLSQGLKEKKAMDPPELNSPTPPSQRPLTLKQYRKQFGRGFQKYNPQPRQAASIDLHSLTALDDYPQGVALSGRSKHLLDNSTLQNSKSTIRTKGSMRRRLALPRLKGRYSVLDRYEN